MDMRSAFILVLAVALVASLAGPAGAFIGTGINFDKHLGGTVPFSIGTKVAAAGSAFGLEKMDLGVTWGVDLGVNTLAGYPFGYGGVGAITDANIGYNIGLSMDETHGVAFDGSPFGVPLAEQSLTSTRFNNFVAKNDHITSEQVVLPFFGFPAI